MKIVAKAIKGKEFFYSAKSAHKVAQSSAYLICKMLNDANYKLNEGEVWHVFDVDRYDSAYEYAEWQTFRRCNHKLYETGYEW